MDFIIGAFLVIVAIKFGGRLVKRLLGLMFLTVDTVADGMENFIRGGKRG